MKGVAIKVVIVVVVMVGVHVIHDHMGSHGRHRRTVSLILAFLATSLVKSLFMQLQCGERGIYRCDERALPGPKKERC